MSKSKYIFILVMILFTTMLVVSGGTFAYYVWQSSVDQQTALSIKMDEDILMTIDPPAISKFGLSPTNNCNGDAVMSGVSNVTINNQTGVLARPRFRLKIKITDSNGNNITNENSPMGNPYRYYVKYAVTEGEYAGACNFPLASGRFNNNAETLLGSGWYDSPLLTINDTNGFPDIYTGVSFNAAAYYETTYQYTVTVWIDENYVTTNVGNNVTNDKLQNATITVSWSENSTVEQLDDGISRPEGDAYAIYSSSDLSLRFYRTKDVISAGDTYNGKTVTAVYTEFEDKIYSSSDQIPWSEYNTNILQVVFEDEIVPVSTAYWFKGFKNCVSFNVTNLNTSFVFDMKEMFYESSGSSSTTFNIIGLNNWNTSNVRNMNLLFGSVGSSASTWNIGDINDWDTSNVRNMSKMFYYAGERATTWSIGDISDWNTSKVTDMDKMFSYVGEKANEISLNLSGWDTSNVISMSEMFMSVGTDATKVILNLSSWDTSNVINMSSMFDSVGMNANEISLNLSSWDTSNVINMAGMFYYTGAGATTWSIGDISGWDTSNVRDMTAMFASAGFNANYILDLRNWNVCNVLSYTDFNRDVMGKIWAPNFGLYCSIQY